MNGFIRQLLFGLLLFSAVQGLGDPSNRLPRTPLAGESLPAHHRVPFVPEYDRQLDRVFMAVGGASSSIAPIEAQRLIHALPDHTRVDVFTHDPAMLPSGDVLGIFGPSSRLRVINRVSHPWSQDLGEGTGERFLLGWKGVMHRGPLTDLDVPLVEHFLPLDGGNVQLARNRAGRKFVLLGNREFDEAEAIVKSAGVTNANAHARRMYCETFDADEVVVLPNWEADHIDQTVLFVGDGRAVTEALPEMSAAELWLVMRYQSQLAGLARGGNNVNVPLYGPEYEGPTRLLSTYLRDARRGAPAERVPSRWMSPAQALLFLQYRTEVPHLNDLLVNWIHTEQRRRTEAILQANGFEITRLKTTVWHQLNCMHFVNAMAFRERGTGQRAVLFPVYHLPGDRPDEFDAARLRKQNRANVATLESIGLRVRPVQSVFGKGGNLHCMMYQL